jgi:hypothetical protein
MAELSPAAQAVLDAFVGDPTERDELEDDRHYLAAALRAAADHLPDPQMSAHTLYAIAAELEQAASISNGANPEPMR